MSKKIAGLLFGLAVVCGTGSASATLLYSQNPDLLSVASNWSASTTSWEPGDNFVLAADSTVTSIQFASSRSDVTNWRLRFYNDNAGQPTQDTGFFEETIASTFSTLTPTIHLITLDLTGAGLDLLGSTTYWLTVAGDPFGGAWGFTSGGDFSLRQRLTGINGPSAPWNPRGQNLYFNVIGDENTGAVPSPATLALFGLGLAGLGWSRRKKA